MRPLGDRVLIRPSGKSEETTRSGLIIPDMAKEKPQEGEVVAVGPGALSLDGSLVPMDVKPGDRILHGKFSGQEIKVDGQDFLIMRQEEILGVLD